VEKSGRNSEVSLDRPKIVLTATTTTTMGTRCLPSPAGEGSLAHD
jgi:hypothetical protein